MFSDPSSGLMLMLLLGFAGILVMFLFLLRAMAAQQAFLREHLSRQEALLLRLDPGRAAQARARLSADAAAPANDALPKTDADLAGLLDGAVGLPPLQASFSGGRRSAGAPLDLKMDPR